MENGLQGNVFAQTAEAVNEGSIAGDTKGTFAVKVGLAQMLKGGVIMDVVTPEQAKIAEEAGACAGMTTLIRNVSFSKILSSYGSGEDTSRHSQVQWSCTNVRP